MNNIEIEAKVQEAIFAAYPVDLWPDPVDKSVKVPEVAYIMRKMAPAIASIARQVFDTVTQSHEEEKAAMVREMLDWANKYGGDEAFVSLKYIAKGHGVDLSKTDVTTKKMKYNNKEGGYGRGYDLDKDGVGASGCGVEQSTPTDTN